MRLEPLYRVRLRYPEGWAVELEGGWEQHLYLAEGRCEGSISGRFRGTNFPQRRTPEGPFRPDLRAVIETDYERYRRLNDVVCVCVGEVRKPLDSDREVPDLVMDVAELIWEPIAD
jgi:hypothetical protein